MQSLFEKHRPSSIAQIIGNRKQIEEIKRMIINYTGKPVFICGPPGTGKNLAVELIAAELDYELIQLTASDFRNYESIKNTIFQSARHQSLLNGNNLNGKSDSNNGYRKGKIILVDELDVADGGMVKGLKEVIAESSFPIVFIASDPYSRHLLELRNSSAIVRMDKIRSDSMAAFLKNVARKEDMDFDEQALEQLARMADGDVRAALIDMESIGQVNDSNLKCIGNRTYEQNVFETLKILFRARSLDNARMAVEHSDKSADELFWWVEENTFREFSNPDEIAASYKFLAKADYFQSLIIRRQTWSLQKYLSDLICCVSIGKKEQARKFVAYQPPRFFSRGMGSRAEAAEIIENLAKATHISKKAALIYIPLLKKIARFPEMHEKMGMSEEEKEIISMI